MSVTDNLTTRDRQLAAWISEHSDFENPFLLVAALRKAEIKPQTALALLSKERGHNIFGCDWGSTGDRPPYCHQRVTETRYKRLRAFGKPNGVGHTQLTSFGFCDQADRRGGAWKPYPNMVTGFLILKQLIKDHGYENGANRYNGGDSSQGQAAGAAKNYGSEFVEFRRSWEKKLVNAGFKVA